MKAKFRIVYETSMTELSANEIIKVKPNSGLWAIVNHGSATVFLETYAIKQGDRFGIDATPIIGVAIAEGFKVRNDTQFTIKFGPGDRKAYLIETTFKKVANEDSVN